ncbi:acyl--CoA ligase [Stappia sp. F7233]|uniref:Acyl--CoA ligase n=1 Tax=Stappia albiluteola TaxID=2758565 RepID=A0A839ACC2_9HYPH|nr:class I adenylate-forming enzyme family protein [Stappia albiluteola]MBA5776796.1 acyl--CoA ligase [Stappia albiluteola]
MILTSEQTIEAHAQSGIWGRITLDALFRRAAASHPDRVALVDAPDRAEWTGGTPRKLTYAEADEEISRLAGFYAAVGLSLDHVIGLHTPNTVDAVIAFLAALRCGLVVTPLPQHWRQRDVLSALSRAGAKALVAADRIEPRRIAEDARAAAAELFSLRFVFGLGKEVPDGLIDIASVLAELDAESMPPPAVRRERNPADHVATLTWTRSTSGEPLPVARSHNHWIAAGFMAFLESSLQDGADLVIPYALTGMAGIGAGLMPWLMSAGTLHLHHPRALGNLAAHANHVEADYILCPGALVPAVERRLDAPECRVLAVWNTWSPAATPLRTNRTVIDLHVADEFAMIARQRGGSALPTSIPLGVSGAPSSVRHGPALVEIALDEEAAPPTLKVRGAMVADSAWPASKVRIPTDKAGFVDTLLAVRQSDTGLAGIGLPGSSAPGSGPLAVLDALYSSFTGVTEAAAFLVGDGILGARLYAALVPQPGAMLDTEAFFAYLDAQGVSLSEVPYRILSLPALPRLENGKINRDALAVRIDRLRAAVA